MEFLENGKKYLEILNDSFTNKIFHQIEKLSKHLLVIWKEEKNLFICGNGGSAANAMHLANDFHYGIGACGSFPKIKGLKVEALPSNPGVITCLANDTGYENIYSHQLINKAKQNDVLITLSGSGNSPNICKAISTARELGMHDYSILGFKGGRCLELSECPIHFSVDDMQIAEDTQLIVGHLCMQWLTRNKPIFQNNFYSNNDKFI